SQVPPPSSTPCPPIHRATHPCPLSRPPTCPPISEQRRKPRRRRNHHLLSPTLRFLLFALFSLPTPLSFPPFSALFHSFFDMCFLYIIALHSLTNACPEKRWF